MSSELDMMDLFISSQNIATELDHFIGETIWIGAMHVMSFFWLFFTLSCWTVGMVMLLFV